MSTTVYVLVAFMFLQERYSLARLVHGYGKKGVKIEDHASSSRDGSRSWASSIGLNPSKTVDGIKVSLGIA